MRISDWSSDVCSSDLQSNRNLFRSISSRISDRGVAIPADCGPLRSINATSGKIDREIRERLLCAVCVQICDALNRCYRTTIKLHIGAERFHCLGEWSRHQHKASEILHPLPRRLDIGRKHFVMIRVGGINATMRLGEREGDWLCHYLAFRAFSIAAIRSSLLVASVRRSEERRVGNEWVSTCRSRWSPFH